MRTICLLNESINPGITKPVLDSIAHAVGRQLAEDYAAFSEAGAPDLVCAAMRKEDVPKAAAVILILDTPDQEGALGYHDVMPNGQPLAKVFVKPITDNGGSLTKTSNSLSQTISHEALEMCGDPYCNAWADDGTEEDAYELCDRVEGDSYEIDGIAVSNFLGPRAFRPGDGPFDFLGLLSAPFTMTDGGYAIRRKGGPTGQVHEIYGEKLPEWKLQLKRAKLHSRGKKRAKMLPTSQTEKEKSS